MDKLLKEVGKLFRPWEGKAKAKRGFVAVVQDVYGGNVAIKTLEGRMPKIFKFPHGVKRGDIISNKKLGYKKKISADCIFVEDHLSKKLSIEADFKEIPVEKMNASKTGSPVRKTNIELKKKTFVHDRFIIKKDGKIIALCQI